MFSVFSEIVLVLLFYQFFLSFFSVFCCYRRVIHCFQFLYCSYSQFYVYSFFLLNKLLLWNALWAPACLLTPRIFIEQKLVQLFKLFYIVVYCVSGGIRATSLLAAPSVPTGATTAPTSVITSGGSTPPNNSIKSPLTCNRTCLHFQNDSNSEPATLLPLSGTTGINADFASAIFRHGWPNAAAQHQGHKFGGFSAWTDTEL